MFVTFCVLALKLEIQETPGKGSVHVKVGDLTAGGDYLSEALV